jgi:Trk-type K+ transport system membrane component
MKFSPYKIFTYLVVIIAYIVVIYKLVDYDNYGDLWLHFTKNLSSHWVYLLICIALMPVNILMEAIKWRAAVANIENISLRQAITATLKGQVGAIATPNKLGDFPTRASSLQPGNRTIGTIMGFVAAWTLSIVIILIGMLGAMLYIAEYHTDSVNSQYLMLTAAICIAATILIFSIPHIAKRINSDRINSPKIKNSLHILQHLEARQLISLSALSFVRYLIFCAQLMFMLMFFGACSGSTGGGIKMARIMILFKYVRNQFVIMLHPRAVAPVKIDGKVIKMDYINKIFAFLFMYFIFMVSGAFVLMCCGFGLADSMAVVSANIANIGPVIDTMGASWCYADFPLAAKVTIIVEMLMGRLEIFAIIAIFSPSYWRR